MASVGKDTKPGELIGTLGDDLLARFRDVPLLDEYDVYEQLLSYWHETMHDDVFLIMHEGWTDAAKPRKAIESKDRKLSETPDLVIGSGRKADKWKTDLIPPALIVARYFADDKATLDELDAAAEEATRAVEEYVEENAGEDGLLWGAMDDGKLTKALATAQLKEAKREGSDTDEVAALERAIALFADESAAKKAAKDAQVALDFATLEQYGDLTEDDVKGLVLDDKWRAMVATCVHGVLSSLVITLVARVRELGMRYGKTLGDIEKELAYLNSRVAIHLSNMGIK